ncbi:MAG TPA: ABC transporter permease [Symbiobacteriaceae bacterium]|nr:ABC transporter permease [Symbiobacteriaceae bacterium]
MLRYIIRRLLAGIPVLLGVSLITFILMHIVPGDPVSVAFDKRYDPAAIASIKHELGLDRPIPVQYLDFVKGAVTGDLGASFQSKKPVMQIIGDGLPATLKLTASSVLVTLLLGIPLGVLAAVKKGTWLDWGATLGTLTFISAPVFWIAMLAQILVFTLNKATGGNWPISGFRTPLHLILPAIVLGSRYAASLSRHTRTAMLDVLGQDYTRTARSKGVSERLVIFKHALKNALVPVLTIVGLEIGGLLTGSILIESVFGIPGVGLATINGLTNRDFPVIQGSVLFTAVIFVLINILVDISYSFVDPRIRIS